MRSLPAEEVRATETVPTRVKEDRGREGYSKRPQVPDEPRLWEAQAVWPAEYPHPERPVASICISPYHRP
jgi:hypothetical protein